MAKPGPEDASPTETRDDGNSQLMDGVADRLFHRILCELADTDVFTLRQSPNVFVVYAHDNKDVGIANAHYVKDAFIPWLGKLRSRTMSDKAPFLAWSDDVQKEDEGTTRNILTSQFCLLPTIPHSPPRPGDTRGAHFKHRTSEKLSMQHGLGDHEVEIGEVGHQESRPTPTDSKRFATNNPASLATEAEDLEDQESEYPSFEDRGSVKHESENPDSPDLEAPGEVPDDASLRTEVPEKASVDETLVESDFPSASSLCDDTADSGYENDEHIPVVAPVRSVQKVLLFGSDVLERYYTSPNAQKYIDKIHALCTAEAAVELSREKLELAIRQMVEDESSNKDFHHVCTELAFLKVRRSVLGPDHGIVQVALHDSNMRYMDFLDNCDVRVQGDLHHGSQQLHRSFFKLLRLVYSQEWVLLDAFQECYQRCLASGEILKTPDRFEAIVNKEVIATFNLLKGHASAQYRDGYRREMAETRIRRVSGRERIVDWLPKSQDVADYHQNNLNQVKGQKRSWVLETESYKNLRENGKDSTPDRLWFYGKPGAGKSVVASAIIDDLQTHAAKSNIAVAYIFCRHGEDTSAADLILRLLTQLLLQRPRYSKIVYEIINRRIRDGSSSSSIDIEDCEKLLKAELEGFEHVFFVVDAPDERMDGDVAMMVLSTLVESRASLVVTSRDIKGIKDILKPTESVEIKARTDDIEIYLNNRLNQRDMQRLMDLATNRQECQRRIVRTVKDKANGIFLLPRLHLDLLLEVARKERTWSAVESALNDLSTNVREKYDPVIETYDQCMRRIVKGDLAAKGIIVITWVLLAKRPIKMDAIHECITQQDDDWENNSQNSTLLLEACVGLIQMVSETSTVTLVHASAEEYFKHHDNEDKLLQWLPDGHKTIATASLRCLSQDTVSHGELWDYAATYWGAHMQGSHAEDIADLTAEYLAKSEQVVSGLQHAMKTAPPKPVWGAPGLPCSYNLEIDFHELTGHPIPSACSGAHVAAFYGLENYLMNLHADKVDVADSNGWTPLWWAILGRQLPTVKALLSKNASVCMESAIGQTLTTWIFGHETKLLPEITSKGRVSLSSKSTLGPTYIMPAEIAFPDVLQRCGYMSLSFTTEEIITEVLTHLAHTTDSIQDSLQPHENSSHRTGVNARDNGGNTALMIAAKSWCPKAVSELIDLGADVSLKNENGRSALDLALKNRSGFFKINTSRVTWKARQFIGTTILLDPNTTINPYSVTTVERALDNMLLQLLPEHIDAEGPWAGRLLRKSVKNRHPKLVRALLARGVCVNTRDKHGYTPLLLACRPPIIHHFKIGKLSCTPQGALHVGMYTGTKRSTFFATGLEDSEAAKAPTSMQHESTVVTTSNHVHTAPLTPFESIVCMLLENGADIEAEVDGGTPLQFALDYEYLSIVKVLLERGANIDRGEIPYKLASLQKVLQLDISHTGLATAIHHLVSDIQTHDYSRLLMDFALPHTRFTGHVVAEANAMVTVANYADFRNIIELSNVAKSTGKKKSAWTPRQEHEERIRTSNGAERQELLRLVTAALDDFDTTNTKDAICLRTELWSFGAQQGISATDNLESVWSRFRQAWFTLMPALLLLNSAGNGDYALATPQPFPMLSHLVTRPWSPGLGGAWDTKSWSFSSKSWLHRHFHHLFLRWILESSYIAHRTHVLRRQAGEANNEDSYYAGSEEPDGKFLVLDDAGNEVVDRPVYKRPTRKATRYERPSTHKYSSVYDPPPWYEPDYAVPRRSTSRRQQPRTYEVRSPYDYMYRSMYELPPSYEMQATQGAATRRLRPRVRASAGSPSPGYHYSTSGAYKDPRNSATRRQRRPTTYEYTSPYYDYEDYAYPTYQASSRPAAHRRRLSTYNTNSGDDDESYVEYIYPSPSRPTAHRRRAYLPHD